MINRIITVRPLPNINMDNILSVEHRQRGLHLTEDEDFVTLFLNGSVCDRWNARTVTLKQIHDEADRYLTGDAVVELARVGGISFETK